MSFSQRTRRHASLSLSRKPLAVTSVASKEPMGVTNKVPRSHLRASHACAAASAQPQPLLLEHRRHDCKLRVHVDANKGPQMNVFTLGAKRLQYDDYSTRHVMAAANKNYAQGNIGFQNCSTTTFLATLKASGRKFSNTQTPRPNARETNQSSRCVCFVNTSKVETQLQSRVKSKLSVPTMALVPAGLSFRNVAAGGKQQK